MKAQHYLPKFPIFVSPSQLLLHLRVHTTPVWAAEKQSHINYRVKIKP